MGTEEARYLEEGLSKEEKVDIFGEVFTPIELVKEILDKLDPALFKDSTKTFLDNSSGHGVFLIEVKNRLMEGLKGQFPDPIIREKHILENQIFGVEIQEDNWQQCRINLGLTPTGNDGNIVCADALRYNYSFLKTETGYYINYQTDTTLFPNLDEIEIPITMLSKDKDLGTTFDDFF
jgi:type I restriction-modification system DNA methylase subunit